MMRIVWDKEELERNIRSEKGEYRLLDFWMPVQLYIDGVDISGLDKVPRGDISRIDDLFLNIFFVFKSLDPEKLGDTEFYFSGIPENEVSAGGFKFFVDYDSPSDNLIIRYSNFAQRGLHPLNISLKQFTEGVIHSTKELLDQVKGIDPAYCADEEYIILKDNMEIIHDWYQERYGTAAPHPPIKEDLPTVKEGRIRWIGVKNAADPELIDCVQKILDIKYPDDYLACVKDHSLGFPYPYNIIVNERIKGGRGQFVRLRGFDPEKPISYVLTLYYALNCPAPGIDAYLPDNVVPFADALGDDRLCFDYREGFPPKVVYWIPHEPDPEESVIFLCNSFTELLEIMEKSE